MVALYFYLQRTAIFEGFSIGKFVTDPLAETNWNARYSGPLGGNNGQTNNKRRVPGNKGGLAETNTRVAKSPRRLFSIRHVLERNALMLEATLNHHARNNYC
jgi:hypothetical protein